MYILARPTLDKWTCFSCKFHGLSNLKKREIRISYSLRKLSDRFTENTYIINIYFNHNNKNSDKTGHSIIVYTFIDTKFVQVNIFYWSPERVIPRCFSAAGRGDRHPAERRPLNWVDPRRFLVHSGSRRFSPRTLVAVLGGKGKKTPGLICTYIIYMNYSLDWFSFVSIHG